MAMIVHALISNLMTLMSDLAKKEVALLRGVPDEIKKLQRTLRRLDKLIASAERKRAVDKLVEDWIRELKDAMYDAQDILDDCQIEAERSSGEAQLQSRRRFSHLFCCFRKAKATHEMGTRISVLNGRLEEIYKARSDLGLEIASGRSSSSFPSPFPGGNIKRMAGPVVDSDISGDKIHEDTEKLVSRLTYKDTSRGELRVVAIVGAGGIGKTTLAQNIYNKLQITSYFSELRMWVCVSQEFNEEELLRKIISSSGCGGDASLAHNSREQLEPKVVDIITGKRLLLVLDDVWDYVKVWEDLLRKLFVSCAPGSRILVTTRNENVARGMGAVCSHRVDLLPTPDGWSLLCKKAFASYGEEVDMERLKLIGMEIVERCDGLPLAIKTLGGILRTKGTTSKAWEDVLRSSAWDVTGLPEGVKAALYLSYEDLPSPLKQCFTYFSLFPEDYIIHRSIIVGLWMAEGFVKEEGDSSIEDVAEGYYRELMQRNLLQPDVEYYDQTGCKMHDLLRSLAQSLTQDESLFAKGGGGLRSVAATSTIMKLRRLSILGCKTMEEFAQVVRKQQSTSLRTLMLLGNSPIHDNLLHSLLPSVRHLRVLNVQSSGISRLPDSLGDLVHLRLLDVSFTSLQALPESIGNLRNLQSLNIDGCDQLSSLPKGIVCLHNLQHLYIAKTGVVGIPSGIDRLKNLNRLSRFLLQQDQDQDQGGVGGEWSTLEDLGPLSQLRLLAIENLHNVAAIEEAKKAALGSKPHLTDLRLYFWRDGHLVPEEQVFSEEETERMEKVLEELCPPPCIDNLTIDCYIGRALPRWMASTPADLSCLRRLDLLNCINCEQLPSLGLLPCLDYLDIRGFRRVVTIGHEFLYSSNGTSSSTAASSWFPKLTELHLWNMPNWEEWQWGEGTPAMPRLEELYIVNSPKLRYLPMGLERHATALKVLAIRGASILPAVGSHPSLEELLLGGTPNLQSVSNLPSLKILKLWDYSNGSYPEWMPSVNPRVHVTWH